MQPEENSLIQEDERKDESMKYGENQQVLQCMMTQSTCYKSTRKMDVKGILWHSTGANNPNIKRYVQPDDKDSNRNALLQMIGVNQYHNDWNHQDRNAGLNAWIGKLADGSVTTVQTMPWDFRPWGCGSGKKGSCNNGWIQFEICEDDLKNQDYFNLIYKEACELTAYLCKIFSIDPKGFVTVSGVKIPTILCHQDSYNLGFGSDHSDVIHWFSKYKKTMDDVRKDVAAIMNSEQVVVETKSEWRVGDIVHFNGGNYYSNANAKTGPSTKACKAMITQIYNGKHPYHCRAVNDNGKFVGGVYGWVDESSISKIEEPTYTPKVGDIVTYHGTVHYSNANAKSGPECIGGKAKISQIYQLGKSKHPYHLIHCEPGCTVYGWVDEGSFTYP